MAEWIEKMLYEIVEFNPRDTIKKSVIAKKIAMDKLQPFCRDITGFELEPFSGGTKFRNGDTIMARITPCLENGKTAKVNILDDGEVGFGSTEYIVFRAKEGIDTDFVYYLAVSPIVREPAIKSMVGSSGRQRVQIDVVQSIKVMVPTLEEQKTIAGVLKSLDDKIAVNKKINDNLEQQMQTLFLNMFPNAFVENNGTVGELISFSNGKKRPDDEGNIPVYGGNGILAYTNVSNNSNCIIIGRVGAYCGSLYYSSQPCWISDNAISAKSIIGNAQLFSYYLLKNALLSSRHIGTSQPLLTQGILNAIPCAIPKTNEINAFNDICTPLQSMADANVMENVQLAYLRDSILPKLMSGEIDVFNIQF